jgi:hypothetical protein
VTIGTSVRIPDDTIDRYPAATAVPAHHTGAELRRLIQMLHIANVRSISVGHGRHRTSIAAAAAVTAAWTNRGGVVHRIVSWPHDGASWLRPARQLVADLTDAWVIADTPAGFAQLVQRLTSETRWSPSRTFGFAAVASPDLLALTGTALSGMTGATATGGSWLLRHRSLIGDDGPEVAST